MMTDSSFTSYRYVLKIQRIFFDPQTCDSKYPAYQFASSIPAIFKPLANMINLEAESIIYVVQAEKMAELPSLTKKAVSNEIILGQSASKKKKKADDSFEEYEEMGESFEDLSLDTEYYVNLLFSTKLRQESCNSDWSLTVDKMITFSFDCMKDSDFFSDLARAIDNPHLERSKDKEILIKKFDFIEEIGRFQFSKGFKLKAYSYLIEDWIIKKKRYEGQFVSKADVQIKGLEVIFRNMVIESYEDAVNLKHCLISNAVGSFDKIILRSTFLHYQDTANPDCISRFLMYHGNTVESRAVNGLDHFKEDESWKLIGQITGTSHSQWHTVSKTVKLYMLKLKRDCRTSSILESCNLFKTKKSTTFEPRNYGFTEVVSVKDISRLYCVLGPKNLENTENDGLIFKAKDLIITGTLPTAIEALDLTLHSDGLLGFEKKSADNRRDEFANGLDWDELKRKDSLDSEFESFDPSLFESLTADILSKSTKREVSKISQITVRLFSGTDFLLAPLSAADDVFLENLKHTKTLQFNLNSSINFNMSLQLNQSLTKSSVDQIDEQFSHLPKILENKRENSFIEIEYKKLERHSLQTTLQKYRKFRAEAIEVKEYAKVGTNVKTLLNMSNISLNTVFDAAGLPTTCQAPLVSGQVGDCSIDPQTQDLNVTLPSISFNLLMDQRVEVNLTDHTQNHLSSMMDSMPSSSFSSEDFGLVLGIAVFQVLFNCDMTKPLAEPILANFESNAFSIHYTHESNQSSSRSHQVNVPRIDTKDYRLKAKLIELFDEVILKTIHLSNPHLNIENYIKRIPALLAAYQSARAVIQQTKNTQSTSDLKKIAITMAEGGKNVSVELWHGLMRAIYKKK